MIQARPEVQPSLFKVGIMDVVPKLIAHQILLPVIKREYSTKMVCREANLEELLTDLALHKLDLVIADLTVTAGFSSRGHSHELGKSSICFLGSQDIKESLTGDFPVSLNNAPMLLPTVGSQLRMDIDQWLNYNQVIPAIVAEFDDSTLMKAFAQEGVGIMIAPTVIKEAVMKQYNLRFIGEANELSQTFYAISVKKKISNPTTVVVIETVKKVIFSS